MSIGFFHNNFDWCNKSIVDHLRNKGIKVEVINIDDYVLDLNYKKSLFHRLYVNRVYPVSKVKSYTKQLYFKDLNNIRFMLNIVKYMDDVGIKVIHPFPTSYIDYSKTEASRALDKLGVVNPETKLISNKNTALKLGKRMKFPKIIKIDLGGGAIDVFFVKNYNQYQKAISNLTKNYHLIHIEDFVEPPQYVTRMFLLDDKFIVAYKKFVDDWGIGSVTKGSSWQLYSDIPKRLINIGKNISKHLKIDILSLDIIESDNEACVIDVNPTPVFYEKSKNLFGFDPTKKIAEYIASVHRNIKK